MILAICALCFVWMYSKYLEGDRVPAATFVMPPVAALALAGLVDPRILWSVGRHRRTLPARIRVIGAVVFGLGLITAAVLVVVSPKL